MIAADLQDHADEIAGSGFRPGLFWAGRVDEIDNWKFLVLPLMIEGKVFSG